MAVSWYTLVRELQIPIENDGITTIPFCLYSYAFIIYYDVCIDIIFFHFVFVVYGGLRCFIDVIQFCWSMVGKTLLIPHAGPLRRVTGRGEGCQDRRRRGRWALRAVR